ncbi:transketolase [Candidatus Peregrinibacteria bacterium]|nr:transketolase [Candidatus Peregrinibacteria bacterium]
MESFIDHLRFLERKAVELRIATLKITTQAGAGSIGGALSVVDLLIAIYYGILPSGAILRTDPEKPGSEEQDYMVFSKGHASGALYAVLADMGFFDPDELKHYQQVNSNFQAFPTKKVPGVSVTFGGAGQGLAAAVGLALSLKKEKVRNNVFCIVGDGEMQTGDFWEAAMLASHYKLDNLKLVVDWNGLQKNGSIRSNLSVDPMSDKFESFGWKTIQVHDGHDYEALLLGLERALEIQRKPSVLIAKTLMGSGVQFAENKSTYHSRVLSEEELNEALPILEIYLESLNQNVHS